MGLNGFPSLGSLGRMMGDYKEELPLRILPATGGPKPFGPDNVPITAPIPPATNDPSDLLKQLIDIGNKIYTELVRQSTASIPKVRSATVDQNGETLDWSAVGYADRLMLANLGPDTVWFAFDQSGGSVRPVASDSVFQLPSGGTVNPDRCKFTKIGVVTATGKSATVCAIGFHNVAGSQQGVIS